MQVHSGLGQNVQRPFVVHRPLVAFGSDHIGHGRRGVRRGFAQRQVAGRAHQLFKLRCGARFQGPVSGIVRARGGLVDPQVTAAVHKELYGEQAHQFQRFHQLEGQFLRFGC